MKLEEQNNNINTEEPQRGVLLESKPTTKKPSMYKVILLNDDYTPMEFVVYVLQKCFNKNQEEATKIMLHVHQNGMGVCGIYTYEVAEVKTKIVVDFAKKNQHPLQCTIEKT
jgi:ATP-dependent Clp protease adaptor protein ClpS